VIGGSAGVLKYGCKSCVIIGFSLSTGTVGEPAYRATTTMCDERRPSLQLRSEPPQTAVSAT